MDTTAAPVARANVEAASCRPPQDRVPPSPPELSPFLSPSSPQPPFPQSPSPPPPSPSLPSKLSPRVVLAAGFDDAARARWVRRLLGEIATREPGARCTLVRAVPDTLRFASQKAPAPMSLPPATQPTQPAQSTPPAQLTQSTQLAQPAQFTPPTSLTLIERRPPCLCCSDAGLADELARLASPLASPLDAPLASAAPRPVCACACAWLIVELPAATLVWTREELLRTLPSPAPRLSTVMVRRPSAANNAAGAALWNLPGLADFDVHDGDSATTAVRAIIQNAARAGDQFLHKNEDQQTRLSYINECKIEGT